MSFITFTLYSLLLLCIAYQTLGNVNLENTSLRAVTKAPSKKPTVAPSKKPTVSPSIKATIIPTKKTTVTPSMKSTVSPTQVPISTSSFKTTPSPTVSPTSKPTIIPTNKPSKLTPTLKPTAAVITGPIVFFSSSQSIITDTTATYSNTLTSMGYSFQYEQDKLFTGGISSTPIGRSNAVVWPQGLHAQAITTGAAIPATVTIFRPDNRPFSILSFTAMLLCNTAATGADFEVAAILQGNDLVNSPFVYGATGYAHNVFTYDTSTSLIGADTYSFTLFCDFALTSITLSL